MAQTPDGNDDVQHMIQSSIGTQISIQSVKIVKNRNAEKHRLR